MAAAVLPGYAKKLFEIAIWAFSEY